MTGGLLDATLVEALLHPTRALDTLDIERLVAALPLPGLAAAVPALASDDPNAGHLLPTEPAAQVIEPLSREAYGVALARLATSTTRPIVVDPVGVRVGEALLPQTVPRAVVRESVVWTRPATALEGQLTLLAKTVAPLDRDTRVRLRDPHGVITPEALPHLFETIPTERLTLWAEDAHGLALAVAHVALQHTRPPLVRTTLLGIGPRCGGAATELLAPGDHHGSALALAAASGHRIPHTHPLWGPALREAAEPELIAWSEQDPQDHYGRVTPGTGTLTPRLAPGTVRLLVTRFLHEWGAPHDAAVIERLTEAVIARTRPGERPDGPTLYTIAATVLDLRALAGGAEEQ